MGRACGTYEGQERCTQDFGGEFRRKRGHLDIQEGRFLGRGGGDSDWINLTQDGDRWQALVNVVMNLWIP
jgi:hypothetical protein